jgi:hypothetical protein
MERSRTSKRRSDNFCSNPKRRKRKLTKKYSSVEQAGVKDRESESNQVCKQQPPKLAAAREQQDFAAEVEAQKEIARLGYERS